MLGEVIQQSRALAMKVRSHQASLGLLPARVKMRVIQKMETKMILTPLELISVVSKRILVIMCSLIGD